MSRSSTRGNAGKRTAPIQVLLVDDHAVVRAGYGRLLRLAGDIEVAAEADSGEQAYAACRDRAFDAVVMDLSLPGMSGIEATKRLRIRDPNLKVLVFSVHEEHIFVRRALTAGALGYINKRAVADVLVDAVRTVARGQRYIRTEFGEAPDPASAHPLAQLSAREFEVLRLLASGYSVAAIADKLHLSPKTVANQGSRLRAKLGAGGTADLTRIAISAGLVRL